MLPAVTAEGTLMDGSLSLILPAYNEAAGIAAAVAEADAALARFCPDYEILVVDDGSSDGTAAAVAAAALPRVRLLRHAANRGYGAALRTGFEAARGDLVAFTDADGQFDLADLERLVYLIGPAPVAVGYRERRQDPWRRRFFSWGYNHLARRLVGTGVRDCDCALKVFRRDALLRLLPESTHFFVNTEMLARARQLGLAVAEAGVRHRPRRHGASKVSLADIPRTLGVLLPFWWTRVLFAKTDTPASPPAAAGGFFSPPAAAGGLGGLLFLLLLTSLLFFCRLRTPLLEPEEIRYAEIPRQMLAADRWVVPVLHGQDYLDKPPLFYWLVMAGYRLFGVHEWAARVVAGLVGGLTVAVVYWWGRRALGPRAALAAGLVLCLTPEFVYRGRMVTPNGLLALFTTAALACGHVSRLRLSDSSPGRQRLLWLLAGALTGLGLLTKGPVAAALVVPPLAIVGWLDRRLARVGVAGWAVFGAAAAAVAGPWYVAVAARCPQFVGYFFWFHNVQRYVAPFDHAKPVWVYLPQLALGLVPWTLLLVPLARLLARRRWSVAVRRPGALGFALAGAVWGLLFFSLAGSKRPAYLVPVLPPLALALGCHLDIALPRRRLAPAWGWLVRHRSALAWRAAAAGLGTGLVGGVTALAAGVGAPRTAALLATGCGLGLLALARRERRARWLTAGGVTFAVLWVAAHDLLPAYAERFSLKRAARVVATLPPVTHRGLTAVYCYPQAWDAVSFYLRRDDVRTVTPQGRDRLMAELYRRPDAVLFVKTTHLTELLAALPAGLEFEPAATDAGVTVGRVRPRREAAVVGYAQTGRLPPAPGVVQ
ncbi:MAG TPA: glycosyltransferase [Gemmataceae bacterium]|jgi:dolichol-phosphate mannosyltransferase